jgi:ABC-type lipoprotein release transport system permease subunit
MIFGAIKPTDTMSLITVLVITAGSVTVASMIPARRALRVSPTIALRSD